jgi:hypothetical protein
MLRELVSKEAQSLPDGDATFQQKGADLVDDAGALTHQPLAHAVHRLKVQLIDGLGRDELHRRALHRFGMSLVPRTSIACCRGGSTAGPSH